jgi:predicted nuclease of predicted toxin-antitoxin system
VNPAHVRLYLDEDVPVQIAPPLRRAGFDVLTTREAGRLCTTDESQLDFAAAEQRVLITRNRDDFTELTERFADASRPHAGVLILPSSFAQSDIGGMARAIVHYFATHPLGVPAYLADFVVRLKP